METHEKIKEEHEKEVTAKALKNVLWETIGEIRRNRIEPEKAHSISKAAQGILATVKLELEVGRMMGGVSQALTEFAYSGDMKLISSTSPKGDPQTWKQLSQTEEPKGH